MRNHSNLLRIFNNAFQKTRGRIQPLVLFFAILVCGSLLAGCATYQMKIHGAYDSLSSGQAEKAAEQLKAQAETENDDQLVYLLEYGTALQLAKKYDESNRAFLRADKLSEVKDYHSLSNIASSLVLSEGMVQYKGEDFEKVYINAFLAINFLMKGQLDEALVETRRLNEKLTRYKNEAKRDYEQNPFARYLSAIIWEADNKWDDAFIDYQEVLRLNPNMENLPQEILWAAQRAKRTDELAKLRARFPKVETEKWWADPDVGELVVIYQQGQGPIKRPHPDSPRFPKLYPRFSAGKRAKVTALFAGAPFEKITSLVSSVQDVAIKTLDDAYTALVAKRVAGIATKAVVAKQIRDKNKTLGDIAWIAMNIADQADLRQWSTLPESLQVARLRLKAGTYTVKVEALNNALQPTGEAMPDVVVNIQPRKKYFLNWRSFR